MGNDVTQVERMKRVELVFALLVSGATRQQIINYCSENFGVEEVTTDKYLKDARRYFAEQNQGTIEENRAWHIAHRKYMMTKAVKAKNMGLELSIAQDLAKIQGLYIDRIQLTLGGKEDEQKTIEARKLLEGSEFKVIEPEGDSEYGT